MSAALSVAPPDSLALDASVRGVMHPAVRAPAAPPPAVAIRDTRVEVVGSMVGRRHPAMVPVIGRAVGRRVGPRVGVAMTAPDVTLWPRLHPTGGTGVVRGGLFLNRRRGAVRRRRRGGIRRLSQGWDGNSEEGDQRRAAQQML